MDNSLNPSKVLFVIGYYIYMVCYHLNFFLSIEHVNCSSFNLDRSIKLIQECKVQLILQGDAKIQIHSVVSIVERSVWYQLYKIQARIHTGFHRFTEIGQIVIINIFLIITKYFAS